MAELGGPPYDWRLHEREGVWSRDVAELAEQASREQWDASRDVPWEAARDVPEPLERAVAQVMTFIAQNEYAALYVPAAFLPQVHPAFPEVLMWLAGHVHDEARHVEVFTKRALIGGHHGYALASTELSLRTLLDEHDFTNAALLLNVLGEGTFLDLLRFVERHAPDAATATAARLAHRDERRHVHFGISHVRDVLAADAERRRAQTADNRLYSGVMGVGTGEPAVAAPADAPPHRRAPTAAEIAWIVLVPWALASLLAIVVLGPPVGRWLFPPDPHGLWPPEWWEARGTPEPVKHGRFVLAALAPLLLAGAIVAAFRRAPRLDPLMLRELVRAGQLLALLFVVVAVLGQHELLAAEAIPRPTVFGVGTLAVAAALVAAALLAMRSPRVAERVARVARETPRRRYALLALATLVAAAWMVRAVYTDAMTEDLGRLSWTLNDVFAVLNGRTPLVDFNPIYGKLLPSLLAPVIATFGTTALVFTIATTTLSVLAVVGVYAIFRRVVRSSSLAVALFVPFLALTSTGVPLSPLLLPAMWPMRYGGAFLIAWLTARLLDGCRPRQPWVVFLVGTLVTVNTVEFGVAATAASVAALLCARPPRSLRDLLALAAHVVAGGLGGLALVALFTLVRAGELPDPGLFAEWPRIFTTMGWFALPVPRASLHLAIYATYVAAVAVATVRVVRGERTLLLTAMVAWSGVFGLGSMGYYVGRPDDLKLVGMFGAWAFALALLTVVTVQALAARGWRRPALAELLVLLGFALAVCSVTRFPLPSDEYERLRAPAPAPQYRPAAEAFVRERTRPGETVVILLPMGHRIAYELGLDNVAPYGVQNAVVTREQLRRVVDTARREGAHEIFVPDTTAALALDGQTARAQVKAYAAAGFTVRSAEAPGMLELSDR